MHMPFALTPLAADWIRVIGQGFGAWKRGLEAELPSRTHTAIWNGYAYFGFDPGAEGEVREQQKARAIEMFRAHAEVAEQSWRDEVLPELHDIYGDMRDAPVEDGRPPEVAAAWERAWAGADRAWQLHFIAINGPYQVLDDLADLYEASTPGAAPARQIRRLIQGRRHELFDMEADSSASRRGRRHPGADAAALAIGCSLDDLAGQSPGGAAFVAGARGASSPARPPGPGLDDLGLASWGEEPRWSSPRSRSGSSTRPSQHRARRPARARGRRAGRRPSGTARRPAGRAGRVRAAARAGPGDRPHHRDPQLLDRPDGAGAVRAPSRCGSARGSSRDGVIEAPDDVLFLRRAEVAELLVGRGTVRALVAERRADHERQQALKPPTNVGKTADRATRRIASTATHVRQGRRSVARGTGASAGIVRGPARVVLGPDDFDRVQPGDIIVCPSSNPSWVPVFTIAGGLVTNTGGVLSHAAVVAREFGLPAVVGTGDATTTHRGRPAARDRRHSRAPSGSCDRRAEAPAGRGRRLISAVMLGRRERLDPRAPQLDDARRGPARRHGRVRARRRARSPRS